MIPTELSNFLKDSYDLVRDELFCGSYDCSTKWTTEHINPKLPEGWTTSYVDGYGGEGEGEAYWSVWKFTNGDVEVYIEFYGWYASYQGSEYQGFQEVEPVEVMKTEWRKA